jgi:hypothetical protein
VNLWQSTYQTKMDIAQKVCEITGYELYQDVDGDIVFKPPFYNLDTSTNRYYRLEDIDIISANFQEKEPNATYITVNGTWFKGITEIVPNADATRKRGFFADYKLIAQFGWRPATLDITYTTDPKVLFYIGVARMDLLNVDVNSASITIPIRSELRPGYPVYIPFVDSYYYIQQMSHSFQYGGTCTTSLTLTCRRRKFHAPGFLKPANPGDSAIDLIRLDRPDLPNRPLIGHTNGLSRYVGFPNVVMALDPTKFNPNYSVVGVGFDYLNTVEDVDLFFSMLQRDALLLHPNILRLPPEYLDADGRVKANTTLDPQEFILDMGNGKEKRFSLQDLRGAFPGLQEHREKFSANQEQLNKLLYTNGGNPQKGLGLKELRGQDVIFQKVREEQAAGGKNPAKFPQSDLLISAEKQLLDLQSQQFDIERDLSAAVGDGTVEGTNILVQVVQALQKGRGRPGRRTVDGLPGSEVTLQYFDTLSHMKGQFLSGSTIPGHYRYYSCSHPEPIMQGQPLIRWTPPQLPEKNLPTTSARRGRRSTIPSGGSKFRGKLGLTSFRRTSNGKKRRFFGRAYFELAQEGFRFYMLQRTNGSTTIPRPGRVIPRNSRFNFIVNELKELKRANEALQQEGKYLYMGLYYVIGASIGPGNTNLDYAVYEGDPAKAYALGQQEGNGIADDWLALYEAAGLSSQQDTFAPSLDFEAWPTKTGTSSTFDTNNPKEAAQLKRLRASFPGDQADQFITTNGNIVTVRFPAANEANQRLQLEYLKGLVDSITAKIGRPPIMYTGRGIWANQFSGSLRGEAAQAMVSRGVPLWQVNYSARGAQRKWRPRRMPYKDQESIWETKIWQWSGGPDHYASSFVNEDGTRPVLPGAPTKGRAAKGDVNRVPDEGTLSELVNSSGPKGNEDPKPNEEVPVEAAPPPPAAPGKVETQEISLETPRLVVQFKKKVDNVDDNLVPPEVQLTTGTCSKGLNIGVGEGRPPILLTTDQIQTLSFSAFPAITVTQVVGTSVAGQIPTWDSQALNTRIAENVLEIGAPLDNAAEQTPEQILKPAYDAIKQELEQIKVPVFEDQTLEGVATDELNAAIAEGRPAQAGAAPQASVQANPAAQQNTSVAIKTKTIEVPEFVVAIPPIPIPEGSPLAAAFPGESDVQIATTTFKNISRLPGYTSTIASNDDDQNLQPTIEAVASAYSRVLTDAATLAFNEARKAAIGTKSTGREKRLRLCRRFKAVLPWAKRQSRQAPSRTHSTPLSSRFPTTRVTSTLEPSGTVGV